MSQILLFGGTTEGKEIAEYMECLQIPSFVSVATEYGKEVLPEFNYCKVIYGRMDDAKMTQFIVDHDINIIIDATHPYAVEVTKNIKMVANQQNIEYVRVLRAANERVEGGRYFSTIDDLIEYINQNPKNTLVTTGSKELVRFKKVHAYERYIYARVLPMEHILEQCYAAGFPKNHVIGMKGPFSIRQNLNQIANCQAEYLVTKDTGDEGGFPEKCMAAKSAGIQLLIIERPTAELGMSITEVETFIQEYRKKVKMKQIIDSQEGRD